ncbi:MULTISPECIES: undecaprenyl-phosphate glucose phosphotransferase [Serratia]|uniref:undecaprenyl-phosphate glucose phosphotransferase n=1 Tax=Serratia TaxID=613 RepID=UPI00237FFAD0|nr:MULTISPECIES: undecaprenyl-phosphate glucose phosphotransferase [Serratia]MDF9720042.1 undecaprenyl-phosphate glucose phosphotransferase [Serratia marcescens]HBL7018668.1 undecaprenyl-phosphate glucose phosphotransferase [Serratia marcescens]
MVGFNSKYHSKTNASLISMVQRITDIFIIVFSLYVVCLVHSQKFTSGHLLIFLISIVVFQMIGGITDFYRSWRGVKLSSELLLVLKNWTLSIIISSGIVFLLDLSDVEIYVFLQWYFCAFIGVIISRCSIRFVARIVRNLGYNTRTVAIVGALPVGINLAKGFNDQPWLGFIVTGIYNDTPVTVGEEIPYAGDFEKLVEDAKCGKIDRVYISMAMSDELKIKEIVASLADTTCSVMLIPDVFTFNILQARTEEVNGVPVVPLFETPISGMNMVLKRLEDIILSASILVFISPVLVCISLAVKLTSPGPIIFRQQRYGIGGKPINVWKFRSMKVMENGGDVVQATKQDSRVTPVGRFLRRTSLDELPQFINVLRGEMSIVGPRPHAVSHNEQYRKLIDGYMLRHKVKPGITGWAQINGWRGETDELEKMQKRIEFDLEYIRNWSVWFDIKIVFLTIFKGFVHKSAY